jgi:GNAT superfamily N-acetyltransferase
VYAVQGRGRVEAAFSVDADRRRHGLATRLMAALERFAMATGAEALVGMCVVRNLPMRRMFEQAGMDMTREDERDACEAPPAQRPANCRSGTGLKPLGGPGADRRTR